MQPNDITIPESTEELDALCERWRSAMGKTFDFDIGPKKQNKLRDAVSQFLGFQNGFQQLKASFPQDLSKTIPYPPDHWPEVIILEDMLDALTLYMNVWEMTPLKGARIKEIDSPDASSMVMEVPFMDGSEPLEEDLVNTLLGMSNHEADDTLMAHYRCERVIVKHPRADKYGLSGIASFEGMAKKIRSQYGYESIDDIEDEHYLMDTGDDGSATVYLKLVKKTKTV